MRWKRKRSADFTHSQEPESSMKPVFDFSTTKTQNPVLCLWIIGLTLGDICVAIIGPLGESQ